MRILVVGAAGRTGRHVVEGALGHGHEVTALVHRTPISPSHPRLSLAHGDVLDFDSLAPVAEGQHAVVVAVNRTPGATSDFYERAVGNVIHAMALHRVDRLAVLSCAGAMARGDRRLPLGLRARIATTQRAAYDDLERMERRIMASALDWSIVRPYPLTGGPAEGRYRISTHGELLTGAKAVPAADAAGVVLKAVESDTYRKRVVVIGE